MAGVTAEVVEEEGEERGQSKGRRSEARQHQKRMEAEEEVVGRGGSWTVGKAERVEEDKGRKEGGTWEEVVVGVGGVCSPAQRSEARKPCCQTAARASG